METHFKPIDSTSSAKVTTTPLTAHYIPESSNIIENAYTRLLWDVLQGNSQNFVRADELIKSWQVFTPLLQQLERDHIQPESYAYGSEGPLSRHTFFKEMTGGNKAAL
jgi:glucose-6-phosphate 1-dehydrogenase